MSTANDGQQTAQQAKQSNLSYAAKGGTIIFAGRILEFVGRFFIGILLARFMGASEYGVYNLADSALALTTVLCFIGLDKGIIHFIPIFRQRDDAPRQWGIILIGLAVPLGISILVATGLILGRTEIAGWFDEPRLAPTLIAVAAGLPLLVLLFGGVSITQGFKRMRYKVIAQDIVLNLAKLVIIGALVFVGLTAERVMWGYVVGLIIAVAVIFALLHRNLFRFDRPLSFAQFEPRQAFQFSLPVYMTNLIMMFGAQIQTILLGVLSTSLAVGVFTAAARVSLVGRMFHSSVVTVAMPQVSDIFGRSAWDELGHFYQTVTKWTFTVNLPLFLGTVFLAEPILAIFGPEFVSGATALIILAGANLVASGTGICGVIITMTERPWLNTLNSALALSATLLLNWWLIPLYGVNGAAWAALLAAMILNGARVIQVVVIYGVWPYNVSFLKPVAAGALTTGLVYFAHSQFLSQFGLIGMGVSGLLIVGLYVGLLLALGLSEEDQFIVEKIE